MLSFILALYCDGTVRAFYSHYNSSVVYVASVAPLCSFSVASVVQDVFIVPVLSHSLAPKLTHDYIPSCVCLWLYVISFSNLSIIYTVLFLFYSPHFTKKWLSANSCTAHICNVLKFSACPKSIETTSLCWRLPLSAPRSAGENRGKRTCFH